VTSWDLAGKKTLFLCILRSPIPLLIHQLQEKQSKYQFRRRYAGYNYRSGNQDEDLNDDLTLQTDLNVDPLRDTFASNQVSSPTGDLDIHCWYKFC